jgi:hypothetical protein
MKFCFHFFVGRIKFLPSRFVQAPLEFRRLYGPNIQQTLLENYFGPETKSVHSSTVIKPRKRIVKQKKIYDYFV